MRSSVDSSKLRPINCNPTGKPSRVKPQGTEIAGWPVKFAGRFIPTSATRTPICSPSTITYSAPIGGAGTGTVGATMASTFCNAASKSARTRFCTSSPARYCVAGTFPPASIRWRTSSLYSSARARVELSRRFVAVTCFGQRNIPGSVGGLAQMRKRNFMKRRAMLFHVAYRRFRRAAHFAVEFLPEIFARAAEAELPKRFAESGAEIFDAMRRGRRGQRSATGKQAEQDCRVGNAAGERADVIECRRKRNGAKYTHAPKGWLQPNDPAHRGGNPNRSARIRADRCDREAR